MVDLFGNGPEEGNTQAEQSTLFDAEELRKAKGPATRRDALPGLAPEATHYYQTGQLPPAYARAMVGLDVNFTRQALVAYNARTWTSSSFARHCQELRRRQDASKEGLGLFDKLD